MKGKIEMKNGVPYFRMARPTIGVNSAGKPYRSHRPKRWGDSWTVEFPTGVRYNGGTIVNEKWVQGFLIASPVVPKGFKLVSISVLNELNCEPPWATRLLMREGN